MTINEGRHTSTILHWGCLIFLLAAIALVILGGGWLLIKEPARPSGPRPAAIVWTATPTPTPTASPTPLPTATPASQSVAPLEIALGTRVRVSGTGDIGLSIRAAAGTATERLDIAAEGETFLVVAGPQSADGLVWWFLRDEINPTREGWAATDYLAPATEQ
ncbi:MAG: hypothetical protein JXA21_29700 [Anaerolineae bacterium]|nr:hypothetical protein [Anaerolineae bacterium]